MNYILKNIEKTQINLSPYPHLIIDNFLDEKLYNEIKETIKDIEYFNEDDDNKNRSTVMIFTNQLKRKEECFRKYVEILSNQEFQKLLIKKLNPKKYKEFFKTLSIQTDCFRNNFNYPIHTDGSTKYMTIVLYVPINNDNKNLGTKIYDRKKKLVKSVEYVPNKCLIFCPSVYSYHNMSAKNTNIKRHSIQSWYFMKKSKLEKYIDRKGFNSG